MSEDLLKFRKELISMNNKGKIRMEDTISQYEVGFQRKFGVKKDFSLVRSIKSGGRLLGYITDSER